MYSLTALEGTLLVLATSVTATALVLGVLRFLARAGQAITAGVECPLIGQRATAQFSRDEWTRRVVDVTSCSVLGTGVAVCRRGCRQAVARSPRFTRS